MKPTITMTFGAKPKRTTCRICGSQFEAKSPTSKYCPECKSNGALANRRAQSEAWRKAHPEFCITNSRRKYPR